MISVITLLFVSCGGSEYPSEGYFDVGEKHYNLNEARIESVGYENDYHQLRLTMDNTENNDFHSISFLMYSKVDTYLPSATYKPYAYDDVYENKFKRGAWSEEGVEMGVILLGEIKVTKKNDIYTIRIDCEDVNGNDVTGYYDGEIKVR